MNRSDFLSQLQENSKGVFFISESEHPFEPENLGILAPEAIPAGVAQLCGAQDTLVKILTPEQFFTKIERGVDPGDTPVVVNAQKIKNLYSFLSTHLEHLQVYRVETGVQVPVYILGLLPDQTVVGVKTISVES